MTSLVLHGVRNFPLISLGMAGVSGIVTTACTVEYVAEHREQAWIKHHDPKSPLPALAPSDKTPLNSAQPNLLP